MPCGGLGQRNATIVDQFWRRSLRCAYAHLQPLLREMISPSWLEYIVVFMHFLLMFIPLSILNHRLSEAVKKSDIGPVDRVLGLVFGVFRGL
jgi:uncharacterized membrane protein required for colicin V production